MTASAWWKSARPSRSRSPGLRPVLALALYLLATDALRAELVWPETLQFHGFASQAAISTTGNNFFGTTKNSIDFDFRELGINSSWQALPDLQLSLQLVSRWAGKTDDGKPRIDYGFADYSFISDADDLWGIRLGRIMTPLGFYNTTRDVPFTRPSIFLPQSIYFDANRNLSLSADGAYFYGEHRTDAGDFSVQAGAGLPRTTDPDLKLVLSRGAPGNVGGELSWLGRLLYERDGGNLRLALTAGQVNAEFDPKIPIPSFGVGSWRFEPFILSAQYNSEHWSLTGEYALRRSRFEGFGVLQPDMSFTGESYYLQATYRFNPTWEGLLRYDNLVWDRQDPSGSKWQATTGLPAYSRFAKDWTIGLRWDIAPPIMLRAEFHHVNGTGWLSNLENPNPFETKQHWNLFALLVSFRF
jgi:hypothetical protein